MAQKATISTIRPGLALWVASNIINLDGVNAAMVLDESGKLLYHARTDGDLDEASGEPLLVRLARFGLEVFVRVSSTALMGATRTRILGLENLGTGNIVP